MAFNKATQANIDLSNPAAYPNGQIKDNSGAGDGTPVARVTMSDMFETFDKILRLAALTYNGAYDNETNGYQYVSGWIALANKNDYILSIGSTSGVLQIQTNLQILNLNERLIGQASVDYNTTTPETSIKGTGSNTVPIVINRPFKNGDYLLLQNTSTGIKIVTLATDSSLNVLVNELQYLKAAAQADENAGTSNTVATTPLTNITAFARRVNGADSVTYLASTTKNGLLSASDKVIINSFVSPVKNVGWMSGVDPGTGPVGSFYTVSGNITQAQITAADPSGGENSILVTMQNAMANTNYFVRVHVETQGNIGFDNDCLTPVFRPISTTTFTLSIAESSHNVQNLKIHIEAVQIS